VYLSSEQQQCPKDNHIEKRSCHVRILQQAFVDLAKHKDTQSLLFDVLRTDAEFFQQRWVLFGRGFGVVGKGWVCRKHNMAHLIALAGLAIYAGSVGARTIIRRAKVNRMKNQGFTSDPKVIERYKLAFDEPMTRKEAALILGVPISAEENQIQQAYKILMSLNHPDKGGSSYMAMKINQAKDVMLLK
jgi:DnaJ homolog subfamily C member 19